MYKLIIFGICFLLLMLTGCTKSVRVNEPAGSVTVKTTATSIPDLDTMPTDTVAHTETVSAVTATNPPITVTNSPVQTENPSNLEDGVMDNNCRLIVNGKDITNSAYVRMDVQARTIELPLTAVLKSLGAEVKYCDENTFEVTFGDFTDVIYLSEFDYGLPIPPGTQNGVRKIVGGDFIVEYDTAYHYLVMGVGVTLNVSYDDLTIEVLG